MMDLRRARTAVLTHVPGSTVAPRMPAAWLHSLRFSVPLLLGGFGVALVADVIHPLALILLQIYLAF